MLCLLRGGLEIEGDKCFPTFLVEILFLYNNNKANLVLAKNFKLFLSNLNLKSFFHLIRKDILLIDKKHLR